MGISALKVVHPYGKWAFSAMVLAVVGLYFSIAGANPRVTSSGVEVTLGEIFTIGIVLYVVSTMTFLYLKLSPGIKRLPAGEKNLKNLDQFIAEHPGIALELDLNRFRCKETTFGQMKEIKKITNKSLVKLASKTIMRK